MLALVVLGLLCEVCNGEQGSARQVLRLPQDMLARHQQAAAPAAAAASAVAAAGAAPSVPRAGPGLATDEATAGGEGGAAGLTLVPAGDARATGAAEGVREAGAQAGASAADAHPTPAPPAQLNAQPPAMLEAGTSLLEGAVTVLPRR